MSVAPFEGDTSKTPCKEAASAPNEPGRTSLMVPSEALFRLPFK